jgi:hypothetical protein
VTPFLIATLLASVYGPSERVAYLRDALAALGEARPAELSDTSGYIDVMDRNECRSAYRLLRARCLVGVAARTCRGQRRRDKRRACKLISDIVVTNKLSEGHFVNTTERFMIMRQHQDFRHHMRAELHRRYGALVTELTLSRHFRCAPDDRECLANGIHDFCIDYADTRSLSWQHCAAAVTWFISTTRATEDDGA